MSLNHGKVWWSELMTGDPEAARAFYEGVCGWRFESVDMPDGTYHVAHAHGGPVAGIMALPDDMAGETPYWLTYVAVGDVDASLREVEAAGGKVLRAAFDVPDTGRIALVQDPTGAMLGLMTPSVDQAKPAGGEDPELENIPV
ncbi:VOC family protein [Vannielia litorea]|uniref:VOC family protein n=1 Tax=Vannielia litorea TaxID=1217970 RepID=UPI001BCD1694|nr:VOC family protein [Vannielia litorea]MBS8227748.1 VOC family protein [Vannielia litorea]